MITAKDFLDFVFCCLSQEQQSQLEISNHNPTSVYQAQENLVKETHGYRCKKCGRFYPFLHLDYDNMLIDPKTYAKPAGNLYKGKKSADVFSENEYYAKNKKTLLKFEIDEGKNIRQTDTIPIMGDVYHVILSQDKKYLATETFGGTIEIIDTQTKMPVAKKRKTNINGVCIFTNDHKLLYFFEDAIRCWDFLNNQDVIVVPVSDAQKQKFGYPKIVCYNILYNNRTQTYLFLFRDKTHAYVVAVKDMALDREYLLPPAPVLSELVYSEAQDLYTISENGYVTIYDSDFCVVERFLPPHIIKFIDGGGVFPVTRFVSDQPNRSFLSPDGKWLLLDYSYFIILMQRENKEIHFCLFSYTGKTAKHMGFVDCNHFWYTWGDTTYIQQIKA